MDSASRPDAEGRPYRNRLKATWARFFQRLGWHVDRDPAGLNGWIPSFAIRGAGVTTLADVRPMRDLSPIAAGNLLSASFWEPIHPQDPLSPKAIRHSLLLLGESPLAPLGAAPRLHGKDHASLGWIHDGADAIGVYEGGSSDWQIAYLLRLPEVSPRLGFSGLSGNWMDRVTGRHFNMMTDNVGFAGRGEVAALWRDCEAETAGVFGSFG
ncbi:hypothetical protein AAFN88_17415 [Pelagibius sp. CAU 1746]|uniref:hypothetical protein n=1 Tax=Pelagibius sp. CAU 1746 TaxID=3140370 RepID=UPI00325AA5D1